MRSRNKSLTWFYTLIQCLYWMTSGLMFNFTSAFLLDRGFSNSQIGAVLGAAYALSAVGQPLSASLFNRSGVRLSSSMACVYFVVACLAALIAALPVQGIGLAVLMVGMLMLQSTMQPSLNSLCRGYALRGVEVNFGFARGAGSAAFSLVCALTGRLLRSFSTRILPAMYLMTTLMLAVCLIAFRAPSFSGEAQRHGGEKREPLLRRHPRFALFLLGLILLSMMHMFIDSFMLQIVRNMGGDSAQQGVVIAIAAMTELPAMMLYARLSRRMGSSRVLFMAAWLWVLKGLLMTLATSPSLLYMAALLQAVSYALYVPATVDYIADTLPQQDFLKGQALAGSAFTLGSLAATFLGGRLLDLLGVRTSMVVTLLLAVVGAVLFTVALLHGAVNRKNC